MEITIQQLLIESTKLLKENKIASPRLDAEVILAHQLGWKRFDLIINSHETVNDEQQTSYNNKIQQRTQGKPVQYITGQQEFMGLTFKVTPDVLIPRPDTEILIETALEEAKAMKKPLLILDIGTGSGAVALSLAHFTGDAKVHTIDISQQALEVAKENAVSLSLDKKVNFHLGDVFSPLGDEFEGKVDLLVSNPPYIPRADIAHLQKEVGYEPSLALDGGVDGLDFYRKLISQGQKFMSPQGRMIFEVGHDQAPWVEQLMEQQKVFVDITKIKDLAGIERVVLGRLKF